MITLFVYGISGCWKLDILFMILHSPLSGSKIVTTSQDNRLYVGDSIFGNLDSSSRKIIHSHDFNKQLTAFRAEWDPKGPSHPSCLNSLCGKRPSGSCYILA